MALNKRYWSKVDKHGPRWGNRGRCWLYTGPLNSSGYGPHRALWEQEHGPVPNGLELDHLCPRPTCVRPSHLEAVTHAENLRRGNGFAGQRARQTHCLRQHPLSGDNLYVRPNGTRWCLECNRQRQRRYRANRSVRASVLRSVHPLAWWQSQTITSAQRYERAGWPRGRGSGKLGEWPSAGLVRAERRRPMFEYTVEENNRYTEDRSRTRSARLAARRPAPDGASPRGGLDAQPKATHIRVRFFLGEPDHETIQHVAEQAQQFLTETMTIAVDVFEMAMAVGTIDPYRVHLRQHPAIEDTVATHVTAHRKAHHCVVSPEPAVRA